MKRSNKQRLFEVMHKVDPTFKLNEDWSSEQMGDFQKRIDISNAWADSGMGINKELKGKQEINRDFASSGVKNDPKQYRIVPHPMGGNNIMNYDENKLDYDTSTWQYLHGKLQDMVEYDKFGYYGEGPKGEGIFKAIVEFPDKTISATIFQWIDRWEKIRGLVVANNDKRAFNDAMEKYNSRKENI